MANSIDIELRLTTATAHNCGIHPMQCRNITKMENANLWEFTRIFIAIIVEFLCLFFHY